MKTFKLLTAHAGNLPLPFAAPQPNDMGMPVTGVDSGTGHAYSPGIPGLLVKRYSRMQAYQQKNLPLIRRGR
ncbi:hypothetical protein LH460_12450 [Laribacter hongkongensis]|uniref:hypothetical protein n=1 Tax=Laribacter hongkongensis TaxID=168471 RepID=UPI001EFC72C1|nr:hypothetical protein [Laribacter hongkongensis]MCG9116894.1 hypothetical protein [Laribacter hongkongensis]MCG9125457.1 hypothetical protein [Laribacter hongkongensis]